MKILIIGKGSTLYKSMEIDFCHYFKELGYDLSAVSTKEFINFTASDENLYDACILFSVSYNEYDNRNILDKISKTNMRCLVIGSVSSLSLRYRYFKYSSIKYSQSRDVLSIKSNRPLLYGCFGGFFNMERHGTKYNSSFSDICASISDLFLINNNSISIYSTKSDHNTHLRTYRATERIFGVRLNAFIWRTFTKYTYGYNIVE